MIQQVNEKIKLRVKQAGARFAENAQRLGAAQLDAGCLWAQPLHDFLQQSRVLDRHTGKSPQV